MNNAKAQSIYVKKHDEALQLLYIESGAFTNRLEGLPNAIRALTTTLQCWLLTEYKREVRTSSDEDLDYHEDVIRGVLDTIEFITKISDCREQVESYRRSLLEDEKLTTKHS